VLFHYAGPAAAGRFGATWTVMQGITAIAGTWGVTKIARYGMLIKKHQFRELDQLWQQSTWRSAIVAALGVIAVLTILFVFKNNRVIQTRFLGWLDTLFLGLATVLNVIVLNQAIYLRAHKREPFVIPSCVGGVVIIVTLLILAPLFGERGATLSYLMPSLVLLPLPTLIFLNCRKKWHAES